MLWAACKNQHANGLTRHTILFVLHKQLNYRHWKPHYLQELKSEDRDRTMEYAELILGWHEDWTDMLETFSGFATLYSMSVASLITTIGFCWESDEADPKITERTQPRQKVTVWCEMIATGIIDHVFCVAP